MGVREERWAIIIILEAFLASVISNKSAKCSTQCARVKCALQFSLYEQVYLYNTCNLLREKKCRNK